jgi:hypothetical protein
MFNARAVAGSLGETGWGLTFSYALIPLIFYYFDRTVNEKSLQNCFIVAMLIAFAIAGTQQYLVWLPVFVLGPWFAYVLIRNKLAKQSVSMVIRNTLVTLLLWICISAYWLVPTFVTFLKGTPPQPGYLVTNQMLDSFSSTNELINVVRLMGVWWPYVNLTPVLESNLWLVLSFVPPVAVALAIIFVKDRKVRALCMALGIISVFIMFFNKGSQEPFPDFYRTLYDIPVVGWMFRVPSHISVFLPLYMGLTITIGVYSLLSTLDRRVITRVSKLVLPSLFLFSVTLIGWPAFRGDLSGTFQENAHQIIMPSINGTKFQAYDKYAIVADATQIETLSELSTTDLTVPPILMRDHDINLLRRVSSNHIGVLMLDPQSDLTFHFLDQNAIIVKPFDVTRNYAPAEVWSVGKTSDPLHGEFHPQLQRFKVNNSDIDYNYGLVFTWGKDQLQIPVDVHNDDDYEIYARFLQSEKGGYVTFSAEKLGLHSVQQTSGASNKFIWAHLGSFHIPAGRHDITLTNDGSLNAVNVIVLVPTSATSETQQRVDGFASNQSIITSIDRHAFIDEPIEATDLRVPDVAINTPIESEPFIPPSEATSVSLEFELEKIDGDRPSKITFDNLLLANQDSGTFWSSDFDTESDDAQWTSLSKSMQVSNGTLNGSRSLHVEVAQGSSGSWHVLTSEKHPIKPNSDVNSTITLWGSGTNGLHGKIIFYDDDGSELKDWQLIFTFPESNHTRVFEKHFVSPTNASFSVVQIWSKQNPERMSEYKIDDVQIVSKVSDLISAETMVLENKHDANFSVVSRNPLTLLTTSNRNNTYEIVRSVPVPLANLNALTLAADIDVDNIRAIVIRALFYDHETNSNATGLNEIVVTPEKGILAEFVLPGVSDYLMNIELESCINCHFVRLTTNNAVEEIAINDDIGNMQWIRSRTAFEPGENSLRIESDGQMYIGHILFQHLSEDPLTEKLLTSQSAQPRLVSEEISPVHHILAIESKTPFVLTMTSKYNPFWQATVNGKSYDPFMFFPNQNGFLIEEAGTMEVSIEYELHKWVIVGLVATTITIGLCVIFMSRLLPVHKIAKSFRPSSKHDDRYL